MDFKFLTGSRSFEVRTGFSLFGANVHVGLGYVGFLFSCQSFPTERRPRELVINERSDSFAPFT